MCDQIHSPTGDRAPVNNGIGDWVGPRACRDSVERRKLKLKSGTPASNLSLYWLSYLGSRNKDIRFVCGHSADHWLINTYPVDSTERQSKITKNLFKKRTSDNPNRLLSKNRKCYLCCSLNDVLSGRIKCCLSHWMKHSPTEFQPDKLPDKWLSTALNIYFLYCP